MRSKIAPLAVFTAAASAAVALPAPAHTHELEVVASIRPIHSLVASVMGDVGTPDLLLSAGASPHTYAMRPSEAAALQDADVVFWVGEGIETFMTRPLENIAGDATVVSLMKADGVTLLPMRSDAAFEAHDHDHGEHAHDDHAHEEHAATEAAHDDHAHGEHAHDDHAAKEAAHDDHAHGEEHAHDDDHAHEEHAATEAAHDDHAHGEHAHDDHAHEEQAAKEAAHDDHAHGEHAHDEHAHEEHAHGAAGMDAHIWLDPHNAEAIVNVIAATLSKAAPEHADDFKANAAATIARLEQLETDMEATLEPVQDRPFIVFHDAYQYMEARYGIAAAGSVTVSPEVLPGASRVAELQERVSDLGAICVFSEPQFEPRIVSVIIEGTGARSGELDPLGAAFEPGKDLYFDMMTGNAAALRDCLTPES